MSEHPNSGAIEGFGASYIRDECRWAVYTMPGAKPLCSVRDGDAPHIDDVLAALRSLLTKAKPVMTVADMEAIRTELDAPPGPPPSEAVAAMVKIRDSYEPDSGGWRMAQGQIDALRFQETFGEIRRDRAATKGKQR